MPREKVVKIWDEREVVYSPPKRWRYLWEKREKALKIMERLKDFDPPSSMEASRGGETLERTVT